MFLSNFGVVLKESHYQILKYIYDNDDVGIKEISSMMVRTHNDHRDFYSLAALLESGYIGFTGPVYFDDNGKLETYEQVRIFQAYSQVDSQQTYDGVTITAKKNDSYLYIGPKSIEYFNTRSETRKGWYLVAALAFVASIISGVIVSALTSG